ncbi:hypothetical protein FRX31_015649 [Thalictrum thalictroides]|uniref:Uncharacterized protein n=1 Tax=Thalictrum thalictroides TaxID=46969 RepID=A0A7J6WD23_THATH|nr:hypothetical protein FRX31_015649 [Thalictrum thalictroides]
MNQDTQLKCIRILTLVASSFTKIQHQGTSIFLRILYSYQHPPDILTNKSVMEVSALLTIFSLVGLAKNAKTSKRRPQFFLNSQGHSYCIAICYRWLPINSPLFI